MLVRELHPVRLLDDHAVAGCAADRVTARLVHAGDDLVGRAREVDLVARQDAGAKAIPDAVVRFVAAIHDLGVQAAELRERVSAHGARGRT